MTARCRTIDPSSNFDAFSVMCRSCRVYLVSMRCTGASHVDETLDSTKAASWSACGSQTHGLAQWQQQQQQQQQQPHLRQ